MFFGAFLGPIFAILLFNSVIFVIVITVLIKHTRKKLGTTDNTIQQTVTRLLISTMGVMALFGLTWLFGVFTVSGASVVFQTLFAIFNSLQGFFIFLFFCVFGREGRELWLKVLCCGKKIPGVTASRPSTAKRQPQPTNRRTSEPSIISSALRSSLATSTRRIASQSLSIPFKSSLVSESETSQGVSTVEENSTALRLEVLEEEGQLDDSLSAMQSNVFSKNENTATVQANPMALQLETLKEGDEINIQHSNADRDSTFSHSSAEESGIEQSNNGSSPPTAEVLVRRSSTVCHHVETAQLRFDDEDDSDSEVVANPNAESI